MLQIRPADVVATPFPHVVKDGIFAPEVFRALKADFPDTSVFQGQSSSHGGAGSRTGSGFDIYRGDGAFDNLTAKSKAWREFADYINSEAFADAFRTVFADHLDDIGLRVDIRDSHVNPAYCEPREVMTETATLGDRVATVVNKVTDPFRGVHPVELFTRLDIHKSMGGYLKTAHCDRPNRLCSLIIYFTDAEAVGLQGGDLLIFEHKQPKPVAKYERHPKPSEVNQVAQLRPRENLGVIFPCQNNSYHGVTPVIGNSVARDFLYINISGRTRSLW
jgi:hypothetical protein